MNLDGLHTVVGNFVWIIANVKSNLLTNADNHGKFFKAASLHQFFMTCNFSFAVFGWEFVQFIVSCNMFIKLVKIQQTYNEK